MVNFCEFDKYAIKSYCAIHGTDETLNLGDITKVDETTIPPFNMICGGSPCQDFSTAGVRKGAVWTCKKCGHQYNPLQVHYKKRDRCEVCGSGDMTKHVLPCWQSGCGLSVGQNRPLGFMKM